MTSEQKFKIELIKVSLESIIESIENVFTDKFIQTAEKLIGELPREVKEELKNIVKEKMKRQYGSKIK